MSFGSSLAKFVLPSDDDNDDDNADDDNDADDADDNDNDADKNNVDNIVKTSTRRQKPMLTPCFKPPENKRMFQLATARKVQGLPS